jgi:hypothetical protein
MLLHKKPNYECLRCKNMRTIRLRSKNMHIILSFNVSTISFVDRSLKIFKFYLF